METKRTKTEAYSELRERCNETLKNEGLKTLYRYYGIGGLIHIAEYIKTPPHILIDACCGRVDISWWNNQITKEERELLTDIYYFYHEVH